MDLIRAEIISVGDEILYGQIVDTNSQWISKELDRIGIRTVRKSTVSDNERDILDALELATKRADIILMTGGLGPTSDDLTKPCLAKFFGCEIVLNQEALKEVEEIFGRAGRKLTETNREQAFLPTACTHITNRAGTAPGMWFHRNNKVYVSMPGVPHEMKTMINEQVLPKLTSLFEMPAIYHKLVKTIGIGESWLSDKIKSWEEQLPAHIKLAYLPSLGEVKLRLTATGKSLGDLDKDVAHQVDLVRPLINNYIYGYDQDTVPKVVGELLRKRNLTLAVAESCTGGSVSKAITSIEGSSRYYTGSIVAYHNHIKRSLLGVPEEILNTHGAVSEQTVAAMANGVRNRLNTDIGIATSGVAGPGGGTKEKPVGTIWTACSDATGTVTKKLSLFRDRNVNIQYATLAVLNLLRQRLVEMDG